MISQAVNTSTTVNAYNDPEHDPYLRLIEAIFNGPYGRQRMSVEQRVRWAQENLPTTYALIAFDRRWDHAG
jgi:hypothetical protein